MATVIKTAVTVNKQVEEVWQAFMNPANLPHWLTGFVSVTPISGQPGMPGSKNKIVLKERGREMVAEETVQEITSPKHFRCTIASTQMNSENDFRFVSFGHYTEIIQTVQLHPNGFMMKLLLPFVKGTAQKTMTNDLMKLKIFIEETNKSI